MVLMRYNWFRKFGWIHVPISIQGWVIWILSIAFLANTFMAIDHASHSVSDTLYGIFPFWVPTILLAEWLAGKTSKD